MTGATLAGIAFILFGCGVIWAGVVLSRSYRKLMPDVPTYRQWSRTEAALCLSGLASGGIAIACFGILTMQFSKGSKVIISHQAPFVDQLLNYLMLILFFGSFGLLFAWVAVKKNRDNEFHGGS